MNEKEIRYEDNPITCTLISFTKLCVDKKEYPCFKKDTPKIHSFFYERKKENSKNFKYIFFDENGNFPWSDEIEQTFSTMSACKLLCSWGIYWNPYETTKHLFERNKTINPEEKNIYDGIAEKFYNEFSCDRSGKLGEHTKLNGIEELVS